MKDVWKNLTLALFALIMGAAITSIWHSGRLTQIEETVMEIRVRVVRIETRLETRAAESARHLDTEKPPALRWLIAR